MRQLAQSVTFGGIPVEGPVTVSSNVGDLISRALTYVFAFAGVALLLMIISSGYTMMLSAGDAKKMEKGRTTLTNSVIGFLLIFGAFWIVQIAGTVFGWENGISQIFGL